MPRTQHSVLALILLALFVSPHGFADTVQEYMQNTFYPTPLTPPPPPPPVNCPGGTQPNPGWPGNGQGQCIPPSDPILACGAATYLDVVNCCAGYAAAPHVAGGGFMSCSDCVGRFIPPDSGDNNIGVQACTVNALDMCFNGGLTVIGALCKAILPTSWW